MKEIGDLSGEGRAYGNIGIAYFSLGDFQKAIEYREKGLKVAKEIGDTVEEGRAHYFGKDISILDSLTTR